MYGRRSAKACWYHSPLTFDLRPPSPRDLVPPVPPVQLGSPAPHGPSALFGRRKATRDHLHNHGMKRPSQPREIRTCFNKNILCCLRRQMWAAAVETRGLPRWQYHVASPRSAPPRRSPAQHAMNMSFRPPAIRICFNKNIFCSLRRQECAAAVDIRGLLRWQHQATSPIRRRLVDRPHTTQ